MQHFQRINSNNRLQHLAAENLYNSSEHLIFDAKTGAHIGYYTANNKKEEIFFSEEIIENNQATNHNQQQLKLF